MPLQGTSLERQSEFQVLLIRAGRARDARFGSGRGAKGTSEDCPSAELLDIAYRWTKRSFGVTSSAAVGAGSQVLIRKLLISLGLTVVACRTQKPSSDADGEVKSALYDGAPFASVREAGSDGFEGHESGTVEAAPIPNGTYRGKGIWGVHSTGKLTVTARGERCEATYASEGSYFCTETRSLQCHRSPLDGALVVQEKHCSVSCAAPEGATSSPCDAADRLSGTVSIVRSADASPPNDFEFLIDPEVVLRRRRWAPNLAGSLPLTRSPAPDAGK